MERPAEEISKATSSSVGKPDVNTANDALHLGGIPAEQYATKEYVQNWLENVDIDLKQYIDGRDRETLQQAKHYTDTLIQNQDFSNFAKLNDLQVLNNTILNKIETCKNDCQTEINTKIRGVVDDVNSNFEDVSININDLRAKTNQLFTSVSNGKNKIARAITDKGISTSATDTFDIMAMNIANIQTGSDIPYDENFVNTGDATATSNDIARGKTAYVKGTKLWGTHKELDTSDATARPEDILEGSSAYVDGIKIYGIYRPLNTYDATALASDILQGKTAYARGQKITGTCVPRVQQFLNVFTQTSEPIKKQGIWIETDKGYSDLTATEDIFVPITYKYGHIKEIPSAGSQYARAMIYKDGFIYIFNTYSSYHYKYDIANNAYTRLNQYSMPYGLYIQVLHITLAGDLILMCARNSSSIIAYNIVADTFDYINNLGWTYEDGGSSGSVEGMCTIGNYVYILKPYKLYKADYTKENPTFEVVMNLDISFYESIVRMVNVGKYLYIFSNYNANVADVYRCDIEQNTYEYLGGIGYINKHTANFVVYGKYIFNFQGANTYVYDITSSETSMTQLDVTNPVTLDYGAVCKVETQNGISVFTSSSGGVQVSEFILEPSTSYYDCIVIDQGISSDKYTNIIDLDNEIGLKYKFDNVYCFDEEGLIDYDLPMYYGNGSQWIKFKN